LLPESYWLRKITKDPHILAYVNREFLFPKMKLKLKGRRFDTIEGIQAESQRVLDSVTEKDGVHNVFSGGS
jgi:hypothetical protein